MDGAHLLGILPTGAGKSVCYQVPALSRYEKTGALSVVISPLVALMAAQTPASIGHKRRNAPVDRHTDEHLSRAGFRHTGHG